MHDGIHVLRSTTTSKHPKWRHQHQQGVYLLACCCLAAFLRSTLTQPSSTGITYGPWNASEDLNEQHKAVLRFILSGDTSFWSRPAVAYRIGFGTAPWRCISRCQAQYYASAAECAPDCTTQTYCEPGDAALSDSNTTCCALSLLDQSYSFSHPSTAVSPSWCNTYPPWGMKLRPSVCDVNVYSARGLQAPLGARDPFLAVSCSRANVTSFYVNGTQYRKDTARRIIHDKDIRKANVTRNIVKRISLRHMAAWHHPSININEPPQFSLVDDLVCLPLEEIYFEDVYFRPDYEGFAVFPDRSGANNSTFDLFDPTTWTCDLAGKRIGNNFYHNLDGFGFELGGEIQTQIINFSYFEMLWDPCGVGRALVQRNETSLNPNLALRNVALDKCLFSPFTELNAMRWSGRARQEWSEAVRNAMVSIKYGNQSLPRIVDALAPDAVATRPFLPDTLKRLTIKRTNDGSHPSKTWRGKPVIKGFLPSEWALLQKLEYLDLSDDMGQGLIEGPIPSTWLMMTKLRTINLTGHSNFCKDWHRIVSYQHFVRCGYVYQVHFAQKGPQIEAKMKPLFDQLCSQPSFYYAGTAALFSKQFASNKLNMSVRIFDLDGHGWQWYDPSTGEAGYTNVIAPDGKCCWDIYSDQIAAHNYRLKGPTTWRDDYQNDYLMSRFFILNDFCERAPPFTIPPKATGPRPPIPPVAPIPPEIPPVPPLTPTTLGAISFPPRPPLFSPLPGISPLRPSAPPQPRLSPSFPGKWTGAWAWRPILPPRPPPSPPPPSPSPSPPLFPPPPPIDCNLAKAQVSFAITNVSRGPFYIGIAVPDMSSLYCKACGCTLQYTALARGFSALYYSSSGLSPPPSNLANISTSVNNWVSNVTISPATSAGRQLMQTTGTLGPLPSLEDLIALGPGRGVLTELNITAPYSSWSSRGSLGAGWRMDPASDGDYLFRIQVGGSIWYRWVVVDSSPPHVSGQLLMSKTPMMVVSPVIAAKDENASPLRYLILNLNMSEPVMEFNLTTALQLSGGVSLFRYECFKSADTAAEVMKGAGVAALATAGSPVLADGPPPPVVPAVPPPSQQQQQPIGGGVVDFAAASGIPFARSCLAELYAAEGSKPSIFLSGCSVKDLSGNRGSGTLSIQIRIPKPELGSTDTVARASAILTSVSFLSVLASRWSVLQSAYHIQMLAMSANMASPGVSSGYRRVARYLRWSLMSIKGNIPLLDKAFKNPKEVNVSDIVNTNLGAELKSANGTNGGPPMPPASPKPPYLPNPLEGPPRRSRARTLISSNEKAPPLAMGTAGLSSSPPSPPAELTAGRDVLIAWLMSMSEFSSGNSSSSKDNTECNSDGNITGSNFYFTNSYVIGGAAAAGNSRAVVGVDSSGRVLNTSDNGGRPPPAPSQAGASTGNIMILADMQDLLYTIATAAILMGGLVLGHALVNLLYCRFISRELPALLHFPRAEMTFGGLLLVSITFYSSFALGGPAAQWGSSRTPAALVMSCIVMPYLVLVWWLTVCRWYLVEKPSEIMEKTSVLLPGAISMQPGAGVDSQQPSSEQNCKDRRSSGNVGGQGTQEGRPTGTDRLLLRHGDSSSKRTACCQTDPLPLRQQVPANPGNVIMGPHWDVAPEDDSMHSANGEWKLGLYRTVSPTRARAALLVGRSIRLLSARPRESTSAIADIRRSRPDVCGLTPEGIILCEEHRNAFHEVESHQQVIPRKDDSFSEAGMAQDSTYQGRHQQNSGAADLSLLVGSFRDMVQSSGALETHREVSGATSTMGADNGQHVKFSPPLGSTKPDSDQQGLRSALPKAAGVASRHPGQGMTEGTSSPGAAAADDNTRIPSVSQGACANLSQRAMRVSGEDNITRLDPQPELLLTVDTTNESFAQHGFRCKDKVTGLPQPTMDESECQIEDVNTLHVKAKKHGSATPTKDRVLITMVDHSNPFSKATDGQAAGQGVVGMPPLKHAVGRAGKKMLPKDARTLDNSISGRWKEDSLRDGPGKHAMEAEGSFLPAVDSAGGVLLQEAPSTMAAADMNNNMKDWAPIPYAAPEVMPRDSVLGENDLAKSFFSSRVLTTRRSSLQQLQGMAGADSRDSGVIYPRRRSTGSYLNNDLAHPKLHTLKPGSRDSLSPSRGSQEHDRPAAPASTNKMGGTEPQVHNFAASNYSSLSRFAQTTSQKQTNTPIKNTNVEIATEDSTQPQELPDRPQQQLIRHAGWLHERNSTKNTPALKMPFGPDNDSKVSNKGYLHFLFSFQQQQQHFLSFISSKKQPPHHSLNDQGSLQAPFTEPTGAKNRGPNNWPVKQAALQAVLRTAPVPPASKGRQQGRQNLTGPVGEATEKSGRVPETESDPSLLHREDPPRVAPPSPMHDTLANQLEIQHRNGSSMSVNSTSNNLHNNIADQLELQHRSASFSVSRGPNNISNSKSNDRVGTWRGMQDYFMHYNVLAAGQERPSLDGLPIPPMSHAKPCVSQLQHMDAHRFHVRGGLTSHAVDKKEIVDTTVGNKVDGIKTMSEVPTQQPESDMVLSGGDQSSTYVPSEENAMESSMQSDLDEELQPMYPGKQVPMYKLHFKPGCWPRRLGVTPTVQFLARFEFLFTEGIGEDDQQKRHETKFNISVGPANLTHKILCAAAFGMLGMHVRSVLQLVLLCVLQVLVLIYLAVCHPFFERLRQIVELVAHGLEMVLFVCAIVLLNAKPDNHAPTNYLMIVCFLIVSLVVVIYGIWIIVRVIIRLAKKYHDLAVQKSLAIWIKLKRQLQGWGCLYDDSEKQLATSNTSKSRADSVDMECGSDGDCDDPTAAAKNPKPQQYAAAHILA